MFPHPPPLLPSEKVYMHLALARILLFSGVCPTTQIPTSSLFSSVLGTVALQISLNVRWGMKENLIRFLFPFHLLTDISTDNSQLFFACFGGAISFVCLVIIVLAWLMCIKKTKKKLPPADVIPDQSYKGCKGESDCSSNKSDMKINRENEYLESYSSNDLGATKIPLNHMPLGGQIPDFRWVWERSNPWQVEGGMRAPESYAISI